MLWFHNFWLDLTNLINSIEYKLGFDEYYKSLRPRLTPEDCTQMFVNRPHPTDPKLQINCRNIWFNEFWSQHHKCSFDAADERHPRCTGNETLQNYEQEGLVPFVGNWINRFYGTIYSILFYFILYFMAPAHNHNAYSVFPCVSVHWIFMHNVVANHFRWCLAQK